MHVRQRKQLILAIASSLGVLMCLRSHFFPALTVGTSMMPTLRSGDLLIVDKHCYRDELPKRGDIVVVRYQNQIMVKRIVGLPREDVEVKHGKLHIDGNLVDENLLIEYSPLNIRKGRLGEQRFAVLGDNRSLPVEFTVHAIVGKEDIIGKVVLALTQIKRHRR